VAIERPGLLHRPPHAGAEDADFASSLGRENAATREQQNQATRPPRQVRHSLAQLDALYFSYVNPVGRLRRVSPNAAGKLQMSIDSVVARAGPLRMNEKSQQPRTLLMQSARYV